MRRVNGVKIVSALGIESSKNSNEILFWETFIPSQLIENVRQNRSSYNRKSSFFKGWSLNVCHEFAQQENETVFILVNR